MRMSEIFGLLYVAFLLSLLVFVMIASKILLLIEKICNGNGSINKEI